MSKEIINRVEKSGLINIDLSNFITKEVVELDICCFLTKNNIVIEKEFRKSLSNYDWKKLTNKNVAVFCSADTILPKWAYMLIVSYLNKVDANAYFGEKKIVTNQLALDKIKTLDIKKYNQKIVLVKGCSDVDISSDLYVEITKLLLPVVKKLMFGEACSSVPIYMKKNSAY